MGQFKVFIFASIVAFFMDLATKQLAVIASWVMVINNSGGLLHLPPLAFIAVAVAVTLSAIALIRHRPDIPFGIPCGLAVGGTWGNVIGGGIDFIPVGGEFYANLADFMIWAGVGMIWLVVLRQFWLEKRCHNE